MNLEALLSTRLTDVLEEPAVRRSPHADFQSGAALALARVRRKAPREIAADVVARADLAGLATAEVSGPGFVNFTISDAVLAAAATEVARDPRLGVPQTEQRETVLVDYSGPNAAKELTVGHLRPTVIGDALVRVLEWLGHDVVRANHLGDWGTSFGMLIEHVITSGDCSYQQARARFDTDAGFKRRAQQRVVLLQSGDAETLGWWERLVTESRRDFLTAYERLGVTLTDGDFAGESSYQPWLAEVVEELTAKGLLVESDGALCAFPLGRDSAPLIVRKSDGGYGYATTDLAALRYRTGHLGATRLLYVVGAPQRTHFAMVFAVARAAGWLPEGVHAEHVAFGSILGPDGKMFRSRSGDPVRLAGLLDEAEARAGTLTTDPAVAAAVAVGAVKYADLSSDRRGDYVFDWDRMLALTGNTGPYLQYAYARISSILDRAGAVTPAAVTVADPAERALVLELLAFEPVVTAVAESLEPHRLTGYLYTLAAQFSTFYERCPVLRAPGGVRESRLTLCLLTGRILRRGLDLLGIATPARL